MKKAKLLSLVLSGILAVSTMSGAVVNADELYDVPEFITTLSELKEYVTEPVTISAEDFLKLTDIPEEELIKFYSSAGMSDEEVAECVQRFYDGEKEILESGMTYTYDPNAQHTVELYKGVSTEYLTESKGTFESGVTYFYNEETKGLIFDGAGELSEKDFCKAVSSFAVEFIFFGNDVTLECHYGARSTILLSTFADDGLCVTPCFTYENSPFTTQFDAFIEEIGANDGDYVYYTVEDGTNPETFVNPLEPLPVCISEQGRLGGDINDFTKPQWFYNGTDKDGGLLEIVVTEDTASFTVEEIFEVSDKYNIVNVNMALVGVEISDLPSELQEFDSIGAVNNALFTVIENRNNRVVIADAEETTEAVEEKTIETVAEPVEILANNPIRVEAEPAETVSVRDCAVIASAVAKGNVSELEEDFDFNDDGKINVRDAAAIAKFLAEK